MKKKILKPAFHSSNFYVITNKKMPDTIAMCYTPYDKSRKNYKNKMAMNGDRQSASIIKISLRISKKQSNVLLFFMRKVSLTANIKESRPQLSLAVIE